MDRQVNWTLAALGDLEAAAEYIERDSPHYAASLIMEILAAGRSLSFLSPPRAKGARARRPAPLRTHRAALPSHLPHRPGCRLGRMPYFS